jgi:hypothetical protein
MGYDLSKHDYCGIISSTGKYPVKSKPAVRQGHKAVNLVDFRIRLSGYQGLTIIPTPQIPSRSVSKGFLYPPDWKRISLCPAIAATEHKGGDLMFAKKLLHGFKGFFRNDRGQNLVEFALLTPVLLVIFMGIFDFGWILHKQIQLDEATRSAARRAVVGANNTEVRTIITNTCSFPVTPAMITIQVKNQNGTILTNSEDRTSENYFTVTVNMPNVQLVTPIKALVDTIGEINLHSESTFLIE